MQSRANPYSYWKLAPDDVYVQRPETLARVRDLLLEGALVHLMGTRGIGKTSFLERLSRALREVPGVWVCQMPTDSLPESLMDALSLLSDELARQLPGAAEQQACRAVMQRAVLHGRRLGSIFEALFSAAGPALDLLVVLYDEADAYGKRNYGQELFAAFKQVSERQSHPKIAVLAAGNLSLAALGSVFGSSFFSRATPVVLEPFSRERVRELSRAFDEPLPDQVVDQLWMSSGGNPGIATFFLQRLWSHGDPPTQNDVNGLLRAPELRGQVQEIRASIFDEAHSRVPRGFWRQIVQSKGSLTRLALRTERRRLAGPKDPEDVQIWHMLAAAGLIHEVTPNTDPVIVKPIPSIIAFQDDDDADEGEEPTSLSERLTRDLKRILTLTHAMAVWLFAEGKQKRRLLEDPLTAMLCVALGVRGWDATAGAVSGAGYADIKAVWAGEGEARVEVKIWGRNDFEKIDQQVRDYRTTGTHAMATVMFAEGMPEDIVPEYETKCLAGLNAEDHTADADYPPLQTYWTARRDGDDQPVAHFLLCLHRRGASK